MPGLVLIDTCIWVPFFSRKISRHKNAVGELLEEDRAAIIGPIVTEILLGFKKDDEADWVASALEGARQLTLGWDDWCSSATLARQLTARGHNLPLSDIYLATVAHRHKCLIYSTDPHFDLIADLQRFEPD